MLRSTKLINYKFAVNVLLLTHFSSVALSQDSSEPSFLMKEEPVEECLWDTLAEESGLFENVDSHISDEESEDKSPYTEAAAPETTPSEPAPADPLDEIKTELQILSKSFETLYRTAITPEQRRFKNYRTGATQVWLTLLAGYRNQRYSKQEWLTAINDWKRSYVQFYANCGERAKFAAVIAANHSHRVYECKAKNDHQFAIAQLGKAWYMLDAMPTDDRNETVKGPLSFRNSEGKSIDQPDGAILFSQKSDDRYTYIKLDHPYEGPVKCNAVFDPNAWNPTPTPTPTRQPYYFIPSTPIPIPTPTPLPFQHVECGCPAAAGATFDSGGWLNSYSVGKVVQNDCSSLITDNFACNQKRCYFEVVDSFGNKIPPPERFPGDPYQHQSTKKTWWAVSCSLKVVTWGSSQNVLPTPTVSNTSAAPMPQ